MKTLHCIHTIPKHRHGLTRWAVVAALGVWPVLAGWLGVWPVLAGCSSHKNGNEDEADAAVMHDAQSDGTTADAADATPDGRLDAEQPDAAEPRAECLADELDFAPSQQTGTINWDQFPEFHLADGLVAVWNGPHFDSAALEPLAHGFTHLSVDGTTSDGRASLDPSARAILWTGVAYLNGQPWREVASPWGNDQDAYLARWQSYWRAYANDYPDTAGMDMPDADLICADIERFVSHDSDILALRTDPNTPQEVAALDDEAFIDRYKRDMARLYATPMQAITDAGYSSHLTSYGDVPIRRTWWGIPTHTWTEWTTDRSLVHFLVDAPDVAGPTWRNSYGPFYDLLDIVAPSAYFFYDYPDDPASDQSAWDNASHWLAYLIFQVEANSAWTDKPLMIFEWMKFHDAVYPEGRNIRPFMAEGAAIFTFMSGANGLWLWTHEANGNAGDPNWSYANYEWFTKGLYRLSRCNSFFEGPHEFWAPKDPVTLWQENGPVMRGVIRGHRMLVAAQNPHAADDETSDLNVVYHNATLGHITLTGREIKLEVYDLP